MPDQRIALRSVAHASDADPYGEFRHVRQSFPRQGQDELVAIEDISFDLKAGTLVSLLGPSGCGKTTFLKIIGGL
ncbi:MAG: ATP-binding cassette domain-containing protein, partial [Acetobacteraceae bacterium]